MSLVSTCMYTVLSIALTVCCRALVRVDREQLLAENSKILQQQPGPKQQGPQSPPEPHMEALSLPSHRGLSPMAAPTTNSPPSFVSQLPLHPPTVGCLPAHTPLSKY